MKITKSWANFYAKTFDFEFLIRNAYVHLEMFKSIYNEQPKTLLEIGSGTGSMSIFWSYLGLDVFSLDNDRKVLKKAENLSKKLNGQVNFVYGDAFRLPFKDRSFDIVFHQGFLEHFSNEQIIQLLNEQLRVGGAVVFSIPNNFYQKKDFGNERLLTKNFWDKLLQTNFRLIESKNYNPVRKKLLNKIPFKVINTMYFAKIVK